MAPEWGGASWRRDGDRVMLTGRKCTTCGKRAFSTARYCDTCHGEAFEPAELGDRGTLYSFSEIHIAPKQFRTPYVVGYVDIADEVRIFAQIEARAADLTPGQPVVAMAGPIREDENGAIVEGYKFRPGGADDV